MDKKDAFAAVALAAVACDGTLGRQESHALRCHLEYRSLYRSSSEADMGELFDRLLRLLRESGVEGLIEQAIRELSTAQVETALAVAAHLVHADRVGTPEEASFLEQLAGQCPLPDGQALTIVRAIEALNRDSLDE